MNTEEETRLNRINIPKAEMERLKRLQVKESYEKKQAKTDDQAEWKINCDGYYPYCSRCYKEPPGRCMTDYCPNCGAEMKGAIDIKEKVGKKNENSRK